MRVFVVFIVLWLSSLAASAQSLPTARLADSLTLRPSATDTAAAIRRLFAAKRRARTKVLLLTGGGFLAVGLVSTYSTFGQGSYGNYNDVTTLDAYLVALGITALGVELIAYGRYSHRNERYALHDWQAHRLSRSVLGDLDPKYFLPTR